MTANDQSNCVNTVLQIYIYIPYSLSRLTLDSIQNWNIELRLIVSDNMRCISG